VIALPPNSALQRTGTHKVLGRGRPSAIFLCGRWRARVLMRRRAVAELGSYTTDLHISKSGSKSLVLV